MAPRGLGTMVAMLTAGRLIGRTDPRLLMGTGLVVVAVSLWLMTGWTPDVSQFEIVTNAVIQGIGIGLVFTPVTVVAFATLPPELRTDGTAFFNLARNVGGAIGISVTSLLLVRDTQVARAVRRT
jgi:DHA2 family multidrug resistance protein